jgi:hypothetical protein
VKKLKLISNVPLVVELENSAPVEKTSNFHDGIDCLYMLRYRGNPAMIFLPVDAALAIKRLGAEPGAEIEIVKKLVNGTAVYSVGLFSDARLSVDAPPALPAAPPVRQPLTMLLPQAQARHSENVKPYMQPERTHKPLRTAGHALEKFLPVPFPFLAFGRWRIHDGFMAALHRQ